MLHKYREVEVDSSLRSTVTLGLIIFLDSSSCTKVKTSSEPKKNRLSFLIASESRGMDIKFKSGKSKSYKLCAYKGVGGTLGQHTWSNIT